VRTQDGKWVRSASSAHGAEPNNTYEPSSHDYNQSINSEFSAGRDYFYNSSSKPNTNLLDQFTNAGFPASSEQHITQQIAKFDTLRRRESADKNAAKFKGRRQFEVSPEQIP